MAWWPWEVCITSFEDGDKKPPDGERGMPLEAGKSQFSPEPPESPDITHFSAMRLRLGSLPTGLPGNTLLLFLIMKTWHRWNLRHCWWAGCSRPAGRGSRLLLQQVRVDQSRILWHLWLWNSTGR